MPEKHYQTLSTPHFNNLIKIHEKSTKKIWETILYYECKKIQ